MRELKTLCGLALIIGMSAGPSSAYTLNNLGQAGGWDNINKSDIVTTVLDTDEYTTDIDVSDWDLVEGALTNAYATWADVSTTDRLSFELLEDHGGNYDAFDGSGSNLDQSSDWNYANIVLGGWLLPAYFESLEPGGGDSILAVTWTAKLRGGNGPRKPTWHAEIFFNDGYNWTVDSGTGFDIETVALHELGHAIGLGHEDVEESVMGSLYAGEQRSLYQDDIDGIAALYGSGGGDDNGRGKPPWAGGPKKLTVDGIDWYAASVTYVGDIGVVPEPSTLAMLAAVGIGSLAYGWRRRRRA